MRVRVYMGAEVALTVVVEVTVEVLNTVGQGQVVEVVVWAIVAVAEGSPVITGVRVDAEAGVSDPFGVIVGTGVCSLASSVPSRSPAWRVAGTSMMRSKKMLLLTCGTPPVLASGL